MPSPVSSNIQGSANTRALMESNASLSGMPNEILDELIGYNPDSVLILRVVSRELQRICDDFLQRNASEILAQGSRMHSPLYPLICNSMDSFHRDSSHNPGHINVQFHLSIPMCIRSLGVPVAECPNKILFLQEICQFDERAQNIEEANLQRIWGHIRNQIPGANPLPAELPADNASPQEIRTWMHANGAVLQGITALRLSNLHLTCVPREIGLCTGLRELNLSNNQLRSLPEGFFQGLVQLQWLYLSDNRLRSLPEGSFQGLVRLQGLGLSSNQLGSLPEGSFQGLDQLLGLNLSNNRLRSLPEGSFQGLVQLQELYLSKNRLRSLPEGSFQGLIQLQRLFLFNNQLCSLPAGSFQGLVQLQDLNLSNNQLGFLPEGSFQGLIQLEELNLSNNQLGSLPAVPFQGLIQLQDLNLSNNQLGPLPEGSFQGLIKLRKLHLSNNQLRSLPEGSFRGLDQLQWLNLHNNQLGSLSEGTFQGLAHLQWLNLYNNRLGSLPEGLFQGLVRLRSLSLHGNPQLLGSYKDWPDANNIAFCEMMRQFFNYECQSPFAGFYRLAAGGGSLEAVEESFSGLPDNIKNAIYGKVWVEAGRPDTGDPQWGEHHTFDDMLIFYGALKRYVRESFEGLSGGQKNAVHCYVSHLAWGEWIDVDSAPGWGELHAFDNILRLIDAMVHNVWIDASSS